MTNLESVSIEFGLTEIENDCWKSILNGSNQFDNPFHHPVVANLNATNVSMRMVVLRKVDIEKRQLFFHTDTRSIKWKGLQVNDTISWLFYNPLNKIQIRLSGSASLHAGDSIADELWQDCPVGSRKIYLGENGPSEKVAMPGSGLPAKFEQANPTPEESEAGRKHFGVVVTTIRRMEWLWLNKNGHRKAAFTYREGSSVDAEWLIP